MQKNEGHPKLTTKWTYLEWNSLYPELETTLEKKQTLQQGE